MFLHAFLKLKIFPIFFSNAKWIYISLKSLMIKFYLLIKIYLGHFPGWPKNAELIKSTRFTF